MKIEKIKNGLIGALVMFLVFTGITASWAATTEVYNWNHVKLYLGDLVVSGGQSVSTGDLTMTSGTIIQERKLKVSAANGKAGGTATVGFVNTGVDLNKVTLAQNATADTWIIPITGLSTGDTITAFSIHGQIDSAGNAATVDADLRKQTAVATGSTDASIGAITQISVTADTKVDVSKTSLAETLDADEWPYVIVTATTAATTDIELLGIEVTYTSGNE